MLYCSTSVMFCLSRVRVCSDTRLVIFSPASLIPSLAGSPYLLKSNPDRADNIRTNAGQRFCGDLNTEGILAEDEPNQTSAQIRNSPSICRRLHPFFFFYIPGVIRSMRALGCVFGLRGERVLALQAFVCHSVRFTHSAPTNGKYPRMRCKKYYLFLQKKIGKQIRLETGFFCLNSYFREIVFRIQIDASKRPCLPLGRTHRGLFAVHKSIFFHARKSNVALWELYSWDWPPRSMQLLRHTFAETPNKEVGRWTFLTGHTVGCKRHTDICCVCNFKSRGNYSCFFLTDCILVWALCSKKPFLTLGLRQIKYIKHLPVSCYFLHGFFFLSELVCSSSDFDQTVPSRSGITGLCLVSVKGHGMRGVTTEKNGD